jgi:hypothetical protein
MKLNIGSNIFLNTSGILNVQGKEQIFLEIGARDSQLLLTMDIYDSAGDHIAKLRRNAWAFNKEEKFEITTDPSFLKLIDKISGEIVVEVNVVGINEIQILHGNVYTQSGQLLEITPQFWRIGGMKMGGNVMDSCGVAVAIG